MVRGTVDDRDMATMVGIDTRMIYTVTFGIGAMLAGVTGVCLATFYPVTPNTGASFLIIAFVTVVLGGLGSITGAFIAGLIVGLAQLVTATYASIALQNVAIFGIFVLVLLVRPQGLLTRRGAHN
jgi:branched-chain amino acid transport system permease protein